jgi:hypothetical protein
MRRRWGLVAIGAILVAVFLGWRLGGTTPSTLPAAPPASSANGHPAPPARPPATKSPVAAPAIELAKAVQVRQTQRAAPGVFEGSVVDADTNEGIGGAELTFSHENGAYSTSSGAGGAFRFAPHATGTYRLISIEAKGYASFEGEFGRSPVSFTSTAGKDITGVVLRLERKRGRPAGRAARDDLDEEDAGTHAPPPGTGSLHGRVFDARTGAPVAAFAIALWQREGIAVSRMIAAASFVDPSGAYEINGLSPGTYEAAAMAAGYASSSYAVAQVADAPVEADFALRAGARIQGIVTDDATKKPIGGAAVSLEGRRGDAPDLPVAPLSPEAETGADGRFTLEHVPSDAVGLRAAKKGYLVRLVSLGPLPEDGDAPFLAIALTPREPGDGARVELTGIGAVLQARADVLEILQVVPEAGAAEAGLVPGDGIVAIDGTPVKALGYERGIAAIRGPEGSTVLLRIRRAGREVDVLVTRKLVRR